MNIYDKKIKNDADFYEKEKKRVAEYMKNRYATDEEYRQRVMEQKKASYHRRKQIILNASQIQVN